MLTVVRRSLGDRRRSASPAQTGALNATCLEEFGERSPALLADALDADVRTVITSVLPRFSDDDLPVPFHGGTTARLLTAYGIMLVELLVHRWDVARAVGGTLAVPSGSSVLGLQALLELLPAWVDPSADDLDVTVHVAGDTTYRLRLRAGSLDVVRGEDVARPPGRVVAAPDLLLALCGRVRPADPELARLAAAVLPL